MSTAVEFRCGVNDGKDRTCGRPIGSANMTERGWLEFDERAFLLPGDDVKNTVRIKCPKHGILEIAHDVIRFEAVRFGHYKKDKLVVILHRDGVATYTLPPVER